MGSTLLFYFLFILGWPEDPKGIVQSKISLASSYSVVMYGPLVK